MADSSISSPSVLLQYVAECEYVNEVPDHLTCAICLGAVRDPLLLSCCGAKYCESCINPVRMQGKPCPNCRHEEFYTMLDKNLQRAVFNLSVYCIHRDGGCEWSGEVIYLRKHVEEKCLFVGVACKYCRETFNRQVLELHEEEECPDRPMDVRVAKDVSKMNARLQQVERDREYWKNEAAALKEEISCLKKTLVDDVQSLRTEREEERVKYRQEMDGLQETIQLLKSEFQKVHGETAASINILNECIPWANNSKKFAGKSKKIKLVNLIA